MTHDPNLPPSARERIRERAAATSRSGSTGWIIGLVILAIIVIGAFFVWPDRASNVAGGGPDTTGTTAPRPLPAPAPSTPAPSAPSEAAPSGAPPSNSPQ